MIMAYYNNGFPATYQPMYYQPQYQQPMQYQQPQPQQNQQAVPQQMSPVQPQQQTNSSIIWVSGEAGAKAYLVAPNTTVQLWDSESQRIFLKSADASGMPSMRVLNYTIEDMPNVNVSKAVSGASRPSDQPDGEILWQKEKAALEGQISGLKGDLDAMRTELETFRGDLYGIAGKKTSGTTKKREAVTDE